MTAPPLCCDCSKKDAQIEFLKALLALNGLENPQNDVTECSLIREVTLKQQIAIIRKEVALVRADVQYLNGHIQSVLQWIARVISVFLSCCGRVSQSAASTIVHSASSVLSNVS